MSEQSRLRNEAVKQRLDQVARQALYDHRVLREKGHYLAGHESDGEEIHTDEWIEVRQLIRRYSYLVQIAESLMEAIPYHTILQKTQVVVGPGYASHLASFISIRLDASEGGGNAVEFAPIVEYKLNLLHGRNEEHEVEDDESTILYLPPFFQKYVIPGRKILLVDDVRMTGAHLNMAYQAVTAVGGEVIGTAVIYDRGEILPEYRLDVPHTALVEHRKGLPVRASECPMCQRGLPLIKPYEDLQVV